MRDKNPRRKPGIFLFEGGKSGLVVGLLGDFGNEFLVDDVVLGVEDNDGAGEEAGERSVHHEDSVGVTELGAAERRERDDVGDAFGGAEAGVGKGEILGDGQDDGVGHGGRQLVEFAHGGGAHAGVEAGEDVKNYPFPREFGERHGVERGADKREVGCPCPEFGKAAVGVDFMSL